MEGRDNMQSLTLGTIVKAINGELLRGDPESLITGIGRIKKHLYPQCLVFYYRSLYRVSFDEMLQKGIRAIVTQEQIDLQTVPEEIGVVYVPDLRKAYWGFIKYYRNLFDIPVIGITGTAGKTTTKEMIAHILQQRYHDIVYSYCSFNALDSKPRYILSIDNKTDAAVIELGLSGPTDIAIQSAYVQPTIGIITNIGIDHMEGCKTLENIIKAKGQIIKGMKKGGTLILNNDDENSKKLKLEQFDGKIIYFGINDKADISASNIQYTDIGMKFILHTVQETAELVIPGWGIHNVYNALAAIAACQLMGCSVNDIQAGLMQYREEMIHWPERCPLKTMAGINGSVILYDGVKSNIFSIEAALEVLKNIAGGRKIIAVMGDVQRVGQSVDESYEMVGKKVADANLDRLITIGKNAVQIGEVAVENGMEREKICYVNDLNHAALTLKKALDSNALVLVKITFIEGKRTSGLSLVHLLMK